MNIKFFLIIDAVVWGVIVLGILVGNYFPDKPYPKNAKLDWELEKLDWK